ncbi:hypothetical protein Efla_003654 [Eimeria flavescens]
MEVTVSTSKGGPPYPPRLGSPGGDSLSSLPQVRVQPAEAAEQQRQQETTRAASSESASPAVANEGGDSSSTEQQQQRQQQQQEEGRRRRGPPSEEERLRVREKYRERLKERKLQIYQRALEEVILREKDAARTRLEFRIHLPTRFGENLYLVGSEACAGSWCLDRAIPMLWGEGNVWTLALALPNGVRRLEYKYVIKEGPHATWEPGSNHTWQAKGSSGCSKPGAPSAAGLITVSDLWGGGAP